MQQLRLMAVHAHPDDESSKGAATMARYVDAGARVRVVTCTGGERGDILNPALADNPAILRDITGYRLREMAQAVDVLGVEHEWLGFVDSGLPEGDPTPPLPEGSFATLPLEETVPALVASLREFRPHVLTTYNELGGYPHPDHIMCHRVSIAAVQKAADPLYRRDLGAAWVVQKVYYDVSFSRDRLMAVHEALLKQGVESPFEEFLERRRTTHQRTPTARIEVADWFERRDAALRAHATQIDPEGFFFAVPRDLERAVWPWEEYELAFSHVPVAEGIETDLFAGVVPEGLDPATIRLAEESR